MNAYGRNVFQSLSVKPCALQDPSMRERRLALIYDTRMGKEDGSGGFPIFHHSCSARGVGLLGLLGIVRRREKKFSQEIPYHLEHLVLVQELQVIEKHEDCEVYHIEMFLMFTFRALHFTFETLHEPCLQCPHLLHKERLKLSAQIAWSWSPACVRRRLVPKVGGLNSFNAETGDDETADYSNP